MRLRNSTHRRSEKSPASAPRWRDLSSGGDMRLFSFNLGCRNPFAADKRLRSRIAQELSLWGATTFIFVTSWLVVAKLCRILLALWK